MISAGINQHLRYTRKLLMEATMSSNSLVKDLVSFFKAARHIWGRCPSCGEVFRLSDAAISSNPTPPRDWLRRLEQQQLALVERENEVESWEAEVQEREDSIREAERDLRYRELRLERDAAQRVREILKSKTEIRSLIRAERKAAVQTSRATLLGKLLERIAPCFRTFSYDPRDMRCISDPFDYVLFDGLTVERRVKQISFIEVKCGRSRLSSVQRSVRDAVEKQRIYTEVWTIGDPEIPITKQLPPAR
jgi:predicted Holliday junction resolvase-like endonuclease